jgi:TP901 family phage tail tape measure protein
LATGLNVGRLVVELSADSTRLTREMSNAQRSLSASAARFAKIGKSLAVGLTLPLAAVGALSTKAALDFETSMVKIETLVGIAQDKVEGFKGSVIDISRVTGKGPRELAEALFFITSAGLRGQRALDALEASAKASALGLGETAVVADAVTSAMNAFAKQGLTAERAVDVLLLTVREGKVAADQLAGAIGKVLPIVAEVGGTFEDAGAFIATFTRVGADANVAATSLRGALALLFKSGTEGKKALAAVGTNLEEVRKSIKERGLAPTLVDLIRAFEKNNVEVAQFIPNLRALSGVLATAGSQGEQFLGIAKRMAGETGVTEKLFERFAETSEFSFNQFGAAVERLRISIGAELLPTVTRFTDSLTGLISKFDSLSDETKSTVVTVGLIAAALGPAMLAVSLFQVGVVKLISAFQWIVRTAPAIVGAIRLVALAFPGTALLAGIAAGIGVVYLAFRRYRSALKETADQLQANADLLAIVRDAQDEIAETTKVVAALNRDEAQSRLEKALAFEAETFARITATESMIEQNKAMTEWIKLLQSASVLGAIAAPLLKAIFLDPAAVEQAKKDLEVLRVENERTLERVAALFEAIRKGPGEMPELPPIQSAADIEKLTKEQREAQEQVQDILRETSRAIEEASGAIIFDLDTSEAVVELERLAEKMALTEKQTKSRPVLEGDHRPAQRDRGDGRGREARPVRASGRGRGPRDASGGRRDGHRRRRDRAAGAEDTRRVRAAQGRAGVVRQDTGRIRRARRVQADG